MKGNLTTLVLVGAVMLAGTMACSSLKTLQRESIPISQIQNDLSHIDHDTEGNNVKDQDSNYMSSWSYLIDDIRCVAPSNDADKKDAFFVYLDSKDQNSGDITLNVRACYIGPSYINGLSGKLVMHYVKQGSSWKFLNVDSTGLVKADLKDQAGLDKFFNEPDSRLLCVFSKYESDRVKNTK